MPSLSPHSFLAKHRLNKLGQAIILGFSTTLLFTGCGGDSPTTRSSTDANSEKPETTYKLTVTSPVKLQNALVRIIDPVSAKELDQKIISSGSEVTFDIKASNADGRLLIAEISGKDNTSAYFDPALGQMTSLNASLHGIFGMLPLDSKTIVSPFTEISYQRALVRANNLNASTPDFSKITLKDFASAVVAANSEVYSTFRVDPARPVPAVSSLNDFDKFIIDTKDVFNPPNTTLEYLNIFYAMGHIKLQQIKDTTDTTPLLTFAKRAGDDMRDGNLDGMTLAGDGKNGTVFLDKPIIPQQIVNADPTLIKRTGELKIALANAQKAAREDYAARLKNAMTALFASLSNPDAKGKNYFETVDFVTGRHSTINDNMPSVTAPRTFGAGNYKYPFGLGNVKLTKEVQKIKDLNCVDQNYADPDFNAQDPNYVAKYQNIDCESGTNADGSVSGYYNALENLVGHYTTADTHCNLEIYFNGTIKLTGGQNVFSSSVNRDQNDAIIRAQENSQDYLLNVASVERNQFIQLRISNQNVISAVAGTVNDIEKNPFPKNLDREELVCQGFNPVFTKPSS